MLQNKQYRPLDSENGVQYLRTSEMKALAAIGNIVIKDITVFGIGTIRENLEEPMGMSKSSTAAAVGTLIQLGVLLDPVEYIDDGFGYKLVSKYRHAVLMDLLKPLDVFWTDKANYRKLVELFVQSRDLGTVVNKRHLTGRPKKFKDFLTTIPDFVVVTPQTQYAPQTYAFTNELRLKIRNLFKITAYFNKWRIDGIKIKAPL